VGVVSVCVSKAELSSHLDWFSWPDAYAEISHCSSAYISSCNPRCTSPTVEGSLVPEWQPAFCCDMSGVALDDYVAIRVWDRDTGWSSVDGDDFAGIVGVRVRANLASSTVRLGLNGGYGDAVWASFAVNWQEPSPPPSPSQAPLTPACDAPMDVVLVFDTSASMSDTWPGTLAGNEAAVRSFAIGLADLFSLGPEAAQLGLVIFADEASTAAPLGCSRAELHASVDGYDPQCGIKCEDGCGHADDGECDDGGPGVSRRPFSNPLNDGLGGCDWSSLCVRSGG